MKLGYIQINDWTPPENQDRFTYGYLEGSMYQKEYQTGIDTVEKEEEWIKSKKLCINTDLYDLSSNYWIVGPWEFFETEFPELLPDLTEEPSDGMCIGDKVCYPEWKPENFGLNYIDSDTLMFGERKYRKVKYYVIVSRWYRVGSGWGSWSDPHYESSDRFKTLQEAQGALKKKLREASDTIDYKIVESTFYEMYHEK